MDRKKKLTAEFWRQDAEMKRQLEERIAYHSAKLAAERGAEKKAAGEEEPVSSD